MNRLVLILVLIIVCECGRNKRTLIWPRGVAKVQSIMGAGFPVDLRDETVIVGIVIKASYRVPQNASDYTSPDVVFARKKRAITQPARWDIYKILQNYAEMYGFGSKGCILRTICDLAETPIDKNSGLIEEILHALFTPSITNEVIGNHADNEYYAAQSIGKKSRGDCEKSFPDCSASFADMFTSFIS